MDERYVVFSVCYSADMKIVSLVRDTIEWSGFDNCFIIVSSKKLDELPANEADELEKKAIQKNTGLPWYVREKTGCL